MDAIYRVDGDRVVTSPDAAGPWDDRTQHGSAPAALVVWAAEAIPTPQPMQIARVTIDLMRPVPVGPLTLETEVLREGATAPPLRWISGNGHSINADLTVSFARQAVGAWILLEAESRIGPDGAGLAMARLADQRGYFGHVIQSLVIEKR
jgi:hypothetical protein